MLFLDSAVAKAIIAKGGTSIERECRQKGKVNDKEFEVTTAGKLKCKHIFHVNTPKENPQRPSLYARYTNPLLHSATILGHHCYIFTPTVTGSTGWAG